MLLFLSNFHICGFLGNFFSQIMLGVFGCIGYLAPLLLFAELLFYASNKGNIRAVYKMIAVEVLLIVLCGLAQLIFGGGYQEGQTILDIYQSAGASGLGGGVIGGAVLVLIAALIMNSTLKLGLPLWAAVVLGAVGAVLGEIGDLSFSIIKRQTGIKDYGHIFPGHGGVLDRFDSVIFVAPFAEFLFRIVF